MSQHGDETDSPLVRLQHLPHIAAREGNETALSLILTKAREASPGRETFLRFLNQRDSTGSTALHQATENGHAGTVYKLLCAGADIDLCDDKYQTALHFAARKGDAEILQHLLDFGSNTRAQDSSLKTPLHLAAYAGHTDAVSLLLKHGKQIGDVEDMDSQTPLFYAAKGHNLDSAKSLADAGANVNIKKYGQPLLHQMASLNDSEAVQLLIEVGADKDAVDGTNRSALYVAAQEGCRNAFASLLKHEAKTNDKDNDLGWVLLRRAVDDASLDAVDLLLKSEFRQKYSQDDSEIEHLLYVSAQHNLAKIAKLLKAALISYRKPGERKLWQVLHRAVRDGDITAVEILCEIGINKETRDTKGRNSVYLAAECHHGAVVEVLKQRKADLGAADSKGETVLHRAVSESNFTAMELLIASGAPLDAIDNEGKTPLHRAAMKEPRGVELLLEAEAKVNKEDQDGRTPLHYAVGRRGYEGLKIVDLLLKNGGKVFVQDRKKDTLLHVAAGSGDHHILTLLFDTRKIQKYYQELINEDGQTALHVAAKRGNLDTALVLVMQGLSTEALDSAGQTPIQVAIKNGHSRVVNQLLALEKLPIKESDESQPSSYLAMLSGNRETVDFVINSKAPELAAVYMEKLYLASNRRFTQRCLKGSEVDETHLTYGEAAQNALNWGLPAKSIPGMMKMGFYDFVVLCDDSETVHGSELAGALKNTLDELSNVTESITDSKTTVHFVNSDKSWSSDSGDSLRQLADEALRTRREGFALGTQLSTKIIKPMVLDKIDRDTFSKPLIVFMIVNGKPESKEEETTFFETIARCSDFLDAESFGKSSVIFVLAELGGGSEPGEFTKDVKKHKRVKDLVFCGTEMLEELMDVGKEPEQPQEPTTKLCELFLAALEKRDVTSRTK